MSEVPGSEKDGVVLLVNDIEQSVITHWTVMYFDIFSRESFAHFIAQIIRT